MSFAINRKLAAGVGAGAVVLLAIGAWKSAPKTPAAPAAAAASAPTAESAAKAGDKALAAFRRGDNAKAREAVDLWLAAAPRDPFARMLSCVLYEKTRQFEAAVKDCDLTVSLKPERTDVVLDALCAAAAARKGLGDRAAAEAGWRKALALAPSGWNRRAEIKLRLTELGAKGG